MSERKNYNPRNHTAEHILNQTMVRMFDRGRSFSAHIEKKKSKCDYHFDRDLSDDEITEIENKVNKVIRADYQIIEEFYSIEDAKEKFNLTKLPDDAGDKIRIIKVGDYDACPCIGDHVSHTKEIGKFSIISTDYNEGVLRVRFKVRNN
ncbi:MAG: hypothetical protein U5K00_05760 [Melioribacteraceae bacterium]|nr:hypothetical protein [Melioribacteraceae bacterium]